MKHPDSVRDPIAELMHEAVRMDESQRQVARHAFLSRLDEELGRRQSRATNGWLVATAAAATLVAGLILLWSRPALDYTIVGASDEGGYIFVQAQPAQLTFSDDTRLRVSPGSRLRVVETEATGARISLEQGKLTAAVTHTDRSDWRFSAGPFQVRVTGTRFDLDWDPSQERLDVVLHEGSVAIEGYRGSGTVAVQAGQRFVGDARARTMLVSDLREPPHETAELAVPSHLQLKPTSASASPLEDESKKGDQPAEVETHAEREAPPSAPRSRSAAPGRDAGGASWAALVAGGQFARVVEEAQQRGVANCLSTCNAAELGALADAARYTKQDQLAERSLLALRARHKSSSGVRAAFLLGRLHEGRGQLDEARAWYERALSESPKGAFAAESLAGTMRTVEATLGRAAAAPVAQKYLQQYPNGLHAAHARKLVQTP